MFLALQFTLITIKEKFFYPKKKIFFGIEFLFNLCFILFLIKIPRSSIFFLDT